MEFLRRSRVGGIVETEDSVLNLAPETGYKPRIEATGHAQVDGGETVFLRSRDGKLYGSVVLSVSALSTHVSPPASAEAAKHTIRPGKCRFTMC